MACMQWLPRTLKTFNNVADQAALLLRHPNTPPVPVVPVAVKPVGPPRIQGRYHPDLDDYDPRTAAILEIDHDENLRVHHRQILCLRSRIKAGGSENEVGHYKKVGLYNNPCPHGLERDGNSYIECLGLAKNIGTFSFLQSQVLNELMVEHQSMEDDAIKHDLESYVDCSEERKTTAWEDETPFASTDFEFL